MQISISWRKFCISGPNIAFLSIISPFLSKMFPVLALNSLFLEPILFFLVQMWPFLEEICFLGTNIAFFGANLAFLAQILLNLTFLHKISNFYVQNKPLSCLNTFFGANIGIFNAKIARLFWNNKIILLYHSKVGDKEIIPLDLSHKQKLVKHSSLVMHTTHLALVLRTRCCMGGMHDL